MLAGKTMHLPLWVSSMTGGAEHAGNINRTLAQACKRFGMGMGLGSCRILLEDERHFADFDVRQFIGQSLPLYANMGIAQMEEIFREGKINALKEMIGRLTADGLILHVNPLQEWFQPEGDRFAHAPIATIEQSLGQLDCPIIVKEVGQGFGPRSLRYLLQLPLAAIEFGSAGGTNFSLLEALRAKEEEIEAKLPMARVGHSAYEMVDMINETLVDIGDQRQCELLIISGGIKNYLDGYYLINKVNMPAIYAQASALLKAALKGTEAVNTYIDGQKSGLEMAYNFLTVKA